MKQQISGLAKQKSIRQLVKYGLVGILGLIIDMGLYYLLVTRLSVHYPFSEIISSILKGNMSVGMIDILISNIIGQTLAVINNFVLNSYFTFKVTDNKLRRFLSFGTVAIVGMIISSMLLTLFIGVMKIDDMIAKVIAIFIVAAIQFSINKFFTFKER
ncbi:GtrA family protein [Dysgonomonas sp. Marseille-P4677]|uniref:GtrA family protein n=1 Tax=Dysgonomonas sp. Marseille-P4677 TaxID=2364790 RepID=UPI001913D3E1|nr:GtrA family protein [Dysgonomonas sp. Marseille-P4677]MBK5721133.1 GtrA family protein [Dysgonomonas sp. Marseille-P4677]